MPIRFPKNTIIKHVNKGKPWELSLEDYTEHQHTLGKGVPVQLMFPGCSKPADKFLLQIAGKNLTIIS